jgi:3-oxoacyl-[acyl-carrier-protein] synthase-1
MTSAREDLVPNVYVVADNIISPLGKTTAVNFAALKAGQTAVKKHIDKLKSTQPFYASLFDKDEQFYKDDEQKYTRFERLLIASVNDALQNADIHPGDKRTVFVISSTKGNISLLETEEPGPQLNQRISLSASAKLISAHFGFVNSPVIVSNACISGVLAMLTAMRLLRTGQYDNAVVAGADVLSSFIVSGFQSFQALSDDICKPFDSRRNGLNLGEGAGTIILSTDKKYQGNIKILSGSVSNDANHISGPSRTGEELGQAIKDAMKIAGKQSADIGFISAHGTATPFNDEMEASAITLAGLQNAPVRILRAHTRGGRLNRSYHLPTIVNTGRCIANSGIPGKRRY